jgi:hypothetical protein
VLIAGLIPRQELVEIYATQFSANVTAPATPIKLTMGSLYIKQPLDLLRAPRKYQGPIDATPQEALSN